jgi:hypothetical protein
MRNPAPVFVPTWRRVSPATPLGDSPTKPVKALPRVSRVPQVEVWRVNAPDPGTAPVSPPNPPEPTPRFDPITELDGARVLPFRPSRPAGDPYRLRMGRDYVADAVRDGEPCPGCGSTEWRAVSAGLWLCGSSLHYWSPPRRALEADAGSGLPVEIETGGSNG